MSLQLSAIDRPKQIIVLIRTKAKLSPTYGTRAGDQHHRDQHPSRLERSETVPTYPELRLLWSGSHSWPAAGGLR
jgi:hypothetical protein